MEFTEKCNRLIRRFDKDILIRKNGTMLLGPGTIPKAKHYIFAGAPLEHIQQNLVQRYNGTIPDEYISLLQFCNGAILFNICMCMKDGVSFATALLTILGIPYHLPMDRAADEEEPYDISIEDLTRHPDIPSNWLKFGIYYDVTNLEADPIDLFVDTQSGHVTGCRRKTTAICDQWNSIDQCLCALFDRFFEVDLDKAVPYIGPDMFLLEVKDARFGGKEVDSLIENVCKLFPESMGKTKRRNSAKKYMKDLFHVQGRHYPRWLQDPDWPMGLHSPMEYLSEKRNSNCIVFTFRDVDTGEIREVEQFY